MARASERIDRLPRLAGFARSLLVVLVLGGAAAFPACSSSPARDGIADASDSSALDASPPTAARDSAPPSLCIDGKPAPYPKGTRVDLFAPMPALGFPTLGGGTYSFATRFEPCASKSKILLLRETAAFCGPCLWSQKHTNELVPTDIASRVELVDLVVSDKTNVAVRTSADLARVTTELGPHAAIVAADPAYTMHTVAFGDRRLPLYVFIDSRTMVVRAFLADPEPQVVAGTLRRVLAELDGRSPRPCPRSP